MYGPVRTVVWEGSGREACPYPDFRTLTKNALKLPICEHINHILNNLDARL